jgi:hypothetical protein
MGGQLRALSLIAMPRLTYAVRKLTKGTLPAGIGALGASPQREF